MTETTDALQLLSDQHDEIDELFAQVAWAADSDEKAGLFRELADKLAAHAAIEERLFYPAVMTDQTCAQLIEATEEHLAIKRVLADLLFLDPGDDHWDAKLAVLEQEVRYHAREQEEAKLFPLVRIAMSDDELAGLGNELLVMFEELLGREPRMQVPAETREAARL